MMDKMSVKRNMFFLILLMSLTCMVSMLFYIQLFENNQDNCMTRRRQLSLFGYGNDFPHPLPSDHTSNITDCFTSKAHCLRLIEQKTGEQPLLISFVRNTTYDRVHIKTGKPFQVPNIVHFISFGTEQPFMFYNYIAYKSIHKYIQPHAIFLWADNLPSEKSRWWKQTIREVANIYFVQTMPPKQIAGKNIKFAAHASDYLRLLIMRGSTSGHLSCLHCIHKHIDIYIYLFFLQILVAFILTMML